MAEDSFALKTLKTLPPLPAIEHEDYYSVLNDREEVFDNFVYNEFGLGFCGCGSPEDSLRSVYQVLNVCSSQDKDARNSLTKEYFGIDSMYDNPLLQALYFSVDRAGLIEHNFTIGGSYLTEAGKLFLPLMEEVLTMEFLETGKR